ncbi:hypothetical protein G6F59_016460 [Rhizopus arrhizus]|nr:hypothetical protein G6F59_016460 [Rhizopus arrhizus]
MGPPSGAVHVSNGLAAALLQNCHVEVWPLRRTGMALGYDPRHGVPSALAVTHIARAVAGDVAEDPAEGPQAGPARLRRDLGDRQLGRRPA